MVPEIDEAIEQAVAEGVPPQNIASDLIAKGWPPKLVNEVVHSWLLYHGRTYSKTGFKTWISSYKQKALIPALIVIFISVITSSIALLRPWPTKIMVDSAFGNVPAPDWIGDYTKPATLILVTSLMTVAIFVSGALIGSFRDYMVFKLSFRLNREVKEESLRHILHLPLYQKGRLSKGDYIHRQNTLTNSLSEYVLGTTAAIAQSIIMVLGILLVMLSFNVRLTVISIIILPALFILTKVYGPRLSQISRRLTKNSSHATSIITESVDNAETVQAYSLEEKQIKKANQLWLQSYDYSRSGLLWGRTYRFTNGLLIVLATATVMYFGGTAALNREISLGELLIFMTYMGYLLVPVQTLASQIAARSQRKADVERVYEVLSDYQGVENLRADKHFPVSKGRIELQNVSYSYGDSMVLNNVSLTAEAGQKVGIIGPSGSGKSTLLKLLPLFLEPTMGKIMIDGIDVQTVSLRELRRAIAWVGQTPQLFNESIGDNLLDSDPSRHISHQEVERAIDVADMKDFVIKLPSNINTIAGEGGNNLSGGQRQRVSLARGLLKDSPIICMDEPTSALDGKSEKKIHDSILQLVDGKTVILVTHHQSLLSLMDVVYVMENGTLVNVESLGGLDNYLLKMNDMEAKDMKKQAELEEARLAEQILNEQNRKRLEELEADNEALQQKADFRATSSPASDDVTIFINH